MGFDVSPAVGHSALVDSAALAAPQRRIGRLELTSKGAERQPSKLQTAQAPGRPKALARPAAVLYRNHQSGPSPRLDGG